ncbi:hypothetical protein H1D32_08635 [Anaerobacillus sp. CMMVII]|uniref:hypothetical protein n=1 Tax=Anaerobacillus sp. CMMVII TaxID=2755588 RepID=UPI0021B7C28C|nr:hypothetical protein [Anaerobacillus sp. CMMVII]MCT8137815.1 hypothetical protein [Anaerobacillus sp. CMMVII]
MSNSFYEKLPNDLLVQFYSEIKKNIENRVLTNAMYIELELIKKIAKKRNIFYRKRVKDLYLFFAVTTRKQKTTSS